MLTTRLPDVKFLLVDDLEENLFAFEQILRREGLTLICARSGPEALEALLVHDFALAIVDVEMPGMDGVELAEVMRATERTRHVPIVFVTAGSRERERLFRGYEAGAVDFLYKPIESVVLRNKAQTFFELSRQKQLLARQLELLREQQRDLEQRNTDLAIARDECKRARDVAEATNRAKDEFLANVSHEIRTPMNAILGMTELVLDTPLGEGQRQSLRTVHSAAGNLLGTINDLLDFSKIEAGKLELDPTPFSLRGAVGETLRALSTRAHRKGLELICDVHPEVPDTLLGDVCRLGQILINLVGNAIKFTEAGEVVVQIGASSRETEVRLRFSIRDTGIGISAPRQQTIFRAFEQEDMSTTRKYGGTGLGLTIAARLIALMGGELVVESEVGRGSTFSFTAQFGRLPSLSVASPAPPATVAASRGHALIVAKLPTPAALIPLSVLVAEDNEFNSQLLEQLLIRRGHRVQLANTGSEALRLVEAGAYDLLLLDVHMPELDGFSVVEQIRIRERGTGSRLPVVAVTARSRKEDRQRCLEAGMDGFLVKPINAAELWATIERVSRNESTN